MSFVCKWVQFVEIKTFGLFLLGYIKRVDDQVFSGQVGEFCLFVLGVLDMNLLDF